MTFGPHHYVPVLKIKRGEKAALIAIDPSIRGRVTPLMEIVERKTDKAPTVTAHLNTAFKGLAECVRPYTRCFLDAREIAPDGPSAAVEVFERATTAGIIFTPVTGISRTADVTAAMNYRTNGLAIRLTRSEYEDGGLPGKVRSFVREHGLNLDQTDLIVDLGAVDDFVSEGIIALTNAFLQDVPDQRLWRTFTVSACAFPGSMGGVDRNGYALVERAEWIAWRTALYSVRHSLQRLPTFSDCAIQHPKGVEGFNPLIMPFSPAVRYTLPEQWLLIKGESYRRTPMSEQLPSLARMLVYGDLQMYFAGEAHCMGCRLIKAAADGAPRLGSMEAWRRLGTIHHISEVINGLASLTWP
jgi:hypothetical protein